MSACAHAKCTHYQRAPCFGGKLGAGQAAGALPPHPQDLALWCLSRCGRSAGRQMKGDAAASPLNRLRPLSRRSGCFPALPYPPLSPGSFYGGGKRGASLRWVLKGSHLTFGESGPAEESPSPKEVPSMLSSN